MRVMIVCQDATSLGAYSVRVRAFVRVLADRDQDVTLVTATEVPPTDELQKWCHRIISFPSPSRKTGGARIFQRIVGLPDPAAPWARKAGTVLRKDMSIRASTDVVFVSSPPHGLQVAGMSLHAAWGVPYVADLRDDWVGNHRARWLTPLHKRVAIHLEQRMVSDASLILANSRQMREQFLLRHPDVSEKVATLTNGFNESEFAGLSPRPNSGELVRVGYLGSDYAGHVPRFLEEIARQWISNGQQARWQIVTHMGAGAASTEIPPTLLNLLPYLPPAESARAMNDLDLLLLLMPPGEREPSPTVPLKTYSYLRTGLPIVYCGERGATSDLLGEFEGTFSLPRCSGAELARFLAEHRDHWGKRYSRAGVAKYSFESLGGELERFLREVARQSRK
jgi:hypothetical protein